MGWSCNKKSIHSVKSILKDDHASVVNASSILFFTNFCRKNKVQRPFNSLSVFNISLLIKFCCQFL